MGTLLEALVAARDGELGVRIGANASDHLVGEVAWAFNGLMERSESVVQEIGRVSRVVGREGRVAERASVSHASGAWASCVDSVNAMVSEVAWRTQEIGRVITAVSEGDLVHKMPLEYDGRPLQGDALRMGTAVNQLVDRLRNVSSEVTRVAREVGTEGKLGGQADVRGVSGTWKDLTDSVNLLAGNLTTQVRNIALVTTAVANGDLSQKITVDARGEILELKDTVNTMVDQLRAFAAEVTRVAKEVGTEGKLGGQAEVKGVSGTWKDLTDNVILMASNLTNQVRGISKVVTAVANGDLTQKFSLAAKGEIAALA
ncbi:MAG TPA: HAMP domain-containing protein, partial [Polyangia bacterium]|nr:HAMP domain-containing protein [Polyangia bacterium]